ncbi:MAG: ABC transporter substrate-binding protein, partial [Thaumarchaeota archaeon]|nr:ABC transporter substrate-binding protein [Nitrososphaerota archaeon]
MAVWIRGILQDDYDVNPLKIKWYTQTEELIPVTYPEGLFAETLPARSNLFRMLEEGKLDALLWPQELEPTRKPVVARLFPDYASIETEYYARTQIYPIMHTLIVKSKILEQEPWVARSLYDAFLEAKDIGVEYSLSSMRVTLPHMQAVIEKSLELMGRDIGPYGIKKNRKTLETLIRYEHEQGLLAKHIGVEELFAETTLDL